MGGGLVSKIRLDGEVGSGLKRLMTCGSVAQMSTLSELEHSSFNSQIYLLSLCFCALTSFRVRFGLVRSLTSMVALIMS